MNKIKVIVCKVGHDPIVETVDTDLKTMQSLVGGYIECLQLDGSENRGIDLWCNEEGRISALPPNRKVFDQFIHGDFFIAAHDDEGETVGLTEREIVRWMHFVKTWPAAKLMN
jgi:hypothetical protein